MAEGSACHNKKSNGGGNMNIEHYLMILSDHLSNKASAKHCCVVGFIFSEYLLLKAIPTYVYKERLITEGSYISLAHVPILSSYF